MLRKLPYGLYIALFAILAGSLISYITHNRNLCYVSKTATNTYWIQRHPTTFHGICAHLYAASNLGENTYVVEHPEGFDKKTHGSLRTAIYIFDSQQKAVDYIESVCPIK